MRVLANSDCPCGSGEKFKRCCRVFHRGAPVPDAVTLVRARYSAYAAGDAAFIQATTHPAAPQFRQDRQTWRREILEFSRGTRFAGLRILGRAPGEEQAEVTFRVTLATREGKDISFSERSRFRRQGGRWLYLSGT